MIYNNIKISKPHWLQIPPTKKRRETIKCNAIVSLERKMSSRSTQEGNKKEIHTKKTQGVGRKHARSILKRVTSSK